MSTRNIIVIGASAGGVYALKELVRTLPADFNVSIFIVMHVSPHSPSHLVNILANAGPMSVTTPYDGELIEPSRIYVAPPDHHMLIEYDQILIKKGPKENRFHPSIDALFRSAAYTYGPRVIGIVLTGMLDDGTSGMWTINRLGGTTIVQEPQDAMYASMPTSVLNHVDVDFIVPIDRMAPLLEDLIVQSILPKPELEAAENERIETEVNIAAEDNAFELGILNMGAFTPLTCPECNGALISIKEGKLIRFRCHTGHAFTASSLLADVTKTIEESLWKAIRSLEETVILLEESGRQLATGGNPEAAKQYIAEATKARKRSEQVRSITFQQEQLSGALAETARKNNDLIYFYTKKTLKNIH